MNKFVILDRDGVINVDFGYVYEVSRLVYVSGIFELLRFFEANGFRIWIATNQSGIGRGYYSEEVFHSFMQFMLHDIREKCGVKIEGYSYCPHFTNIDGVCSCRKPLTGMIQGIRSEIDFQQSFMVGDNISDYKFAQNLNLHSHYNIGNVFDDDSDFPNTTKLINVENNLKIIEHLIESKNEKQNKNTTR